MEHIKLNTELRKDTGKNNARKLRARGRIPAVLYGRKKEPLGLAIDEASIKTILHAHPESAVIDLSIEGKAGKPVNVLVRDVQRHPANGRLLHVDFQRIKLDEKVRIEVRVTLQGDPRGVKEQGGLLEHGARELNINCLPTAMPESIDVDVTDLLIGDSYRLSDLIGKYPGLDFLDDPETTIATVVPPIVEAKVEVEGEEVTEPEVIAKEAEKEETEGEDSR